jgi:aconitate hydratase
LVVAYAIAGSLKLDLTTEPLGTGADGQPVFLKDVWPTTAEIADIIRETITPEMFEARYGDVFKGDERWQAMGAATGGDTSSLTYMWDGDSTYVRNPPYFDALTPEPAPLADIENARILGLFLDSITTDHISPAGAIAKNSPAGQYLQTNGVSPADFNSYGSRRGNHEVMMRGTFANIRIKNQMVPDVEGGVTLHQPSGEQMPIFDAATRYHKEGTPTVIFAGKEYGTGSSRDWAAKGPRLLGVAAVIAQSFERIHRSNLVGMGVLPLVFEEGTSWQTLGLTGREKVSIAGLEDLEPRQRLVAWIISEEGAVREVPLICCIDTLDELNYFRHGGILQYVLRGLAAT